VSRSAETCCPHPIRNPQSPIRNPKESLVLTVRLTLNRFILLGLAVLALAALTACGGESAPPAATATPVGAIPATATPRPLPASPPTVATDQMPSQPQLTGGPAQVPQPQVTTGAGQVPQPQLTGGPAQVPQPQVTGSPAVVTPGAVDPDEPPRISLQDLQQVLTQPDTLLVDVRTAGSYAERHIPGAVSFPFSTIDQHIQDVPRDKFIVAYCQ
jgi:hypothetical protein